MKGLTFENFINHPTNQNAYDICFRLSRFEGERKSPIVLLGERGSGKSHLLWALVNYYRTNQVNVGIALISANNFPSKVKELAVVPAKLASPTPVVVLVDELHQFSPGDAGDLEKVLFAVNEHGHVAVLATEIHPNVLPMLSGKFKAFLNSGVIVGMKPLPKSDGSSIPEAALQQIAALKNRVANLESSMTRPSEAGVGAQSALNNYADVAVRESAAASLTEIEAWQRGLSEILERFETQKARYETRLGELSLAADRVLAASFVLRRGDNGDSREEGSGTVSLLGELDEAKRRITLKDKEISQLRLASGKLAEALERQEMEVNTVISSIRETVVSLSRNEPGQEPGADGEAHTDSRKTLTAIAEQLQALEDRIPDSQERELPPLMDSLEDDDPDADAPDAEVEFPTPADLERGRETGF